MSKNWNSNPGRKLIQSLGRLLNLRTDGEQQPLRPRLLSLEPRILYDASPLGALLDQLPGPQNVEPLEPVEDFGILKPADFWIPIDHLPATPDLNRLELVFIDGGVENIGQLIADLKNDSLSTRRLEFIILDSAHDGVDQITQSLAGREDIAAIHFVSHGTDRAVKLGGTWLTNDSLATRSADIATWGNSLAADGDLLFYGCDLAGSEEGRAMLESVSVLSGRDVAASSDGTGHTQMGGNWILEFYAGEIESSVVFSSQLQEGWQGLLASFTVTNTNDSGAGSFRQAVIDSNGLAGADTITFNIAGAGPHTINLLSALPTITGEVIIDGWTEPDYAGTPVIVLNGSAAGGSANGLVITAGNSTVRGFVIQNFGGDGIQLSGGGNNTIEGNYIGLDATGTVVQANGDQGIQINSANNTIGGLTAASRNVISGNASEGILISTAPASGNQVLGNYIGTDASGTQDRGNTDQGIRIRTNASGNTVGGSTDASRNVISGNDNDGIQIDGSGTNGNVVRGNYIGTTASGLVALANLDDGIEISGGATNTIIGGTGAGDRNVIAGNTDDGIQINDSGTTGTLVFGNYIGVGADGLAALGNANDGVEIYGGATNNSIGGIATGSGNVIANNSLRGIRISDSSSVGNSILRNSFHSNSGIGIDLDGDGVSANDPGDGDSGPNNLQNFPVLASSVTSGGNTTITGSLNSIASSTFRVEFFASPTGDGTGFGEGRTFLGFVNATTDGGGNAPINTTLVGVAVPAGYQVSATATFLTGGVTPSSTSEFAANVTAQSNVLVVDTTSDVADGDTSSIAALIASRGADGFISLREAIIATNNTANGGTPDEIWFNIPGAGPHTIQVTSLLPTVNERVIINGTTEPDFTGTPVIVLDGSLLGAGFNDGLVFSATADGSELRGLVINQFARYGIWIQPNSDGIVIAGNFIGTDAGGTLDRGNVQGVIVQGNNAVIGGLSAADRNLISGNTEAQIFLVGDGNTAIGNYLGTTVSGNAALSMTDGTFGQVLIGYDADNNIVGSSTAAHRNIIAGGVSAGVYVFDGNASGNQIIGNRIGLAADGSTVIGNAGHGVFVTSAATGNIIGTIAAGEGNTIVGSGGDGVHLDATAGTGNTIRGNSIYGNSGLGIDLGGDGVTANDGLDGDTGANNLQNFPLVFGASSNGGFTTVTGSFNSAASNTYTVDFYSTATLDPSGYGEGQVYLGSRSVTTDASGNAVINFGVNSAVTAGHYITATLTDASGNTSEFSQGTYVNDYNAVVVDTVSDVIDGNTSSIALLYANRGGDGVISLREAILATNATANGPSADRIWFTILGSGPHTIALASALPDIGGAVFIDGWSEPNYVPGTPIIELNGASAGAVDGLKLGAGSSGSTIRGLIINRFGDDGIDISSASSGNTIAGNWIGLSNTGNADLGNQNNGIEVDSAGNIIGGTTAAERNVISGNNGRGIAIFDPTAIGNVVIGNYIGLNAAGTAIVGNSDDGIGLLSGASNNTIGGIAAGSRNVISGNTQGIFVDAVGTTGNVVIGNYIGTDFTGTLALGNFDDGIQLNNGASNNRIGGNTAGERNVISGNVDDGIDINNSAGNTIIGNYVGTNAAGTGPLGNSASGITVRVGSQNNTIGGPTLAERNVISANTIGVYIRNSSTSGNVVLGNSIGADVNGADLGNTLEGVLIDGTASNNIIGGTTAGAGNLIFGNGTIGVNIRDAGTLGNAVLGNAIYDNDGIGVDLAHNGVTPNDPGDGDSGPNNLQNFPVLAAAITNGINSVTVTGTLNSTASTTFRIEFFANTVADGTGFGEGQRYLGFQTVTTDGSGDAAINQSLSATVNAGEIISATATRDLGGGIYRDSSEFAFNITAVNNVLIVDTTSDVSDGDTSSISSLLAGRGADGFISLREAIIAANNTANGGSPDEIHFNIGGTGPHTISVLSALPDVTEAIVIDGTTDPDFAGSPIIELDGTSAGASTHGLHLTSTADGSTIRGLVINRFSLDGIRIDSNSDFNTIAGNWIGLDTAGTTILANGGHGINIGGGNNTIGGATVADRNVISGNSVQGILISNGAANNQIFGNYIGTDATGTLDRGNALNGIYIAGSNNTIGGPAVPLRNVISGNNASGIHIAFGPGGNVISGNHIGTDAAGTAVLGNSLNGVTVQGSSGNTIGGFLAGAGNLIRGNTGDGVNITGTVTGNTVLRNLFFENGQSGIDLGTDGPNFNDPEDADSGANDLLNYPVLTNIIQNGANLDFNLNLDVPAGNYRIEFFDNPTGVDGNGFGEGQIFLGFAQLTASGAAGYETFSMSLGGVTASDVRNITATATQANGTFTLYGSTSEFSPQSPGPGVLVVTTTSDVSDGDTSGIAALLGNRGADGFISLREAILATNNTINVGGPDQIRFDIAGAGPHTINLLASLPTIADAVVIDGSTEPDFAGTPIVELNGTSVGANGFQLSAAASGSTLRGLVINRFAGSGVYILSGSNNNTIEGNYFGLNVAGDTDLGNGAWGVRVEGNNNTIGGNSATQRNVLSGNGQDGIVLQNATATGNVVQGNYIGTNAAGSLAIGNSNNGVTIQNGASGNTIGGSGSGEGNVISGSTFSGIVLAGATTQNNTIQGNRIGTDAAGTADLGNSGSGIDIYSDAHDNLLGGTLAGAGNTIAFNNRGITIQNNAVNNSVLSNWIHSNDNLGIDLASDGVTLNDPGDADSGPNNLLNFPVITSAVTYGTNITIAASLNGQANSFFRVELFASTSIDGTGYGEGERFLGYVNAGTDGSGFASWAINFSEVVAAGEFISATATQTTDNNYDTFLGSSEFSQSLAATATGVLVVDTVSDLSDGDTSSILGLLSNRGADGFISLREAILATNNTANAGSPDEIHFNIAGAGVHAILPLVALPTITDGVIIDGLTQFGASAGILVTGSQHTLMIELSGASSTGIIEAGLDIRADDTVIRGLIINNWTGQVSTDGIQVLNADNVTIESNYIGTNATGTAAAANQQAGILLESTTNSTIRNNLASGNTIEGIVVRVAGSTGNVIQGNLVGTNAAGNAAVGNLINGVAITNGASGNTIGGTTATTRNIISGNQLNGVRFSDSGTSGNFLYGNHIGTDISGLADLGNGLHGVLVDSAASGNLIGGSSAGEGNLISGNDGNGVNIVNAGTTGNIVAGNIIGLNLTATSAIANSFVGVAIALDADANIIGTAGGGRNIISGNAQYGVRIVDTGTDNNVVQNNIIGMSGAGTYGIPNAADGIRVESAGVLTGTVIGGTTAGLGNVISSNGANGIFIRDGVTNTTIAGNIIGLNEAGNTPFGNIGAGIRVLNSGNNLIGGGTAAARNLISGNAADGILLTGGGTSGNRVQGNFIGTNAVGTSAIGNSASGIRMESGASGNIIGTDLDSINDASEGNLVSGNSANGIQLWGAPVTGNLVRGNLVGVNATATAVVGNGTQGIQLGSGASGNTIGGTVALAANVVGGSTFGGIELRDSGTSNNLIQGNFIGTNSGGAVNLGNGTHGIIIGLDPTNNTIGGTLAGAGNTIAFNSSRGVTISAGTATGNSILRNSIYSNSGPGIDLGNDGVTANDPGDGDSGANDLQNFPVIDTANSDGAGSIHLTGSLNSNASTNYRIEFFASTIADGSGHGEAERYLGFVVVVTDAGGNATFDTILSAVVGDGEFLTATATVDLGGGNYGSTSEFSQNILASTINDAPVVTAPGAALTAIEQTNLAIHGTGFGVSDADEANAGGRATISVGQGSITIFAGDSGITIDSGNNTGTVVFSGTIAQINNLLTGAGTGTILYFNPFDAPTPTTTISVTVNDLGNTGTDPGLTGDATSEEGVNSQTINITPVNDSPFLSVNTVLTLNEGATAVITATHLNEGDPDDDGPELTYTVTGGLSNGQLELTTAPGVAISSFTQDDIDSGRLVYVHDGSETTADSFGFSLADGGEDGATPATGTFNISITPVNDNSTTAISDTDAAGDTVAENAANGTAVGITAFADDADAGDTITYSLDDNDGGRFKIDPVTGVVSVNGPIDREAGGPVRSITVRATSTDTSFQTRIFNIAVGDVDEFDVGAVADIDASANVVDENATGGTVAGITAQATDNDATTNIVSWNLTDDAGGRFAIDPVTGMITVNGPLDYESATSHSVTVRALSQDGSESFQTFSIAVNDLNEAPAGSNSTVSTNEDVPLTLLISDFGFSDPDAGDGLASVRIDALPAAGQLLLGGIPVLAGQVVSAASIAGGNLTWQPPAEAFGNGIASMGFTVADSGGLFATTGNTLVFDVLPVNDDPVANPSAPSTSEDTLLTANVSGSDIDSPSSGWSYQLLTGPANSNSFVLNPDGSFSYMPSQNFNGIDSFLFRMHDGQGGTSDATVTINVVPVNDSPMSIADVFAVLVGSTLDETLGVLANDFDVENDPLIAVLVTPPSNGTIIFSSDGTFVYIPAPGFFGVDQFSYLASDGQASGSPVQVTIQVEAVSGNGSGNGGSGGGSGGGGGQSSGLDDKKDDPLLFGPDGLKTILSKLARPKSGADDLADTIDAENIGNLLRSGINLGPDSGDDLMDNASRIDLIGALSSALENYMLAGDNLDLEVRPGGPRLIFSMDGIWESLVIAEREARESNQLFTVSPLAFGAGAVTFAAAMTYLLWYLRGGVLMATLLTQIPTWRMIDPLPILDSWSRQRESEDDMDSFFGTGN